MTINELQNVVLLEALILSLICVLIISAFKRWKKIVYLCSAIATIAAFSAWSFVLALGSLFVYAPSSMLLWHELDRQPNMVDDRKRRLLRACAWVMLAVGVLMLIGKNIYNIYLCLN
jgi:hypothetical protein